LEKKSADRFETAVRNQSASIGLLGFLAGLEVRQFFCHPRCFHLLPLLAFGVFLAAWVYPVASPFLPVIVVVFAGLEPQFNNIFFRSENELAALNCFPVPWREIVLAKNIATMTLVALVFIIGSMALLYFYPGKITGTQVQDGIISVLTVLFPMLHIGNRRSIDFPRRACGFRIDDFIELLWILVTLGVLSIPYLIMRNIGGGSVMCIVYAVGTIVYWLRVSVPRTAESIEKEVSIVCSNP